MAGVDSGGDPKKTSVQVNVIPMIDMMMLLVVFLLTNFAESVFEDVSSLVAKMPVFGPDNPEDQPPDEDPNQIKSLKVRMGKETGYTIFIETGAGALAPIEIPLSTDNQFDDEKLSEELSKVKQEHPTHEDCLLLIEKEIEYKNVVNAMDHIREQVTGIGSPQIVRSTLFPSISLTAPES